MGILEDVSGKSNHDLWLAPMIVVPKCDNTPRRVIDFSLLNKFCKRSAEATLDTNRMATAVPVPEEGKEIFFSCLDDDSIGVNATEIINKTDLEEVIYEVNNLDLNKNSDKANLSSALLGSW